MLYVYVYTFENRNMIANKTGKVPKDLTQTRRIDFMEKYFPLVGGKENIGPITRKLFSFIFVRDPFSRLVSGYTQKMIHDWEKDALFRFGLLSHFALFSQKVGKDHYWS